MGSFARVGEVRIVGGVGLVAKGEGMLLITASHISLRQKKKFLLISTTKALNQMLYCLERGLY